MSAAAARPLWLRFALGLGVAAAVALGVTALLLGGGYALLQTRWAQAKLAAEVVAQAKGALQGKLSLGDVRLSGAVEVCVDDVDLRDPEGHPAFAARSLCASLEAALLRSRVIHLRSLALVAPVLDLAEVPGAAPGTITTTLQRALAPRAPPGPEQPAGPFAWSITLDRLDLREGAVLLRSAPGAAPRFALEGLSLAGGSARYSALGAAGRLALSGKLATPGGLAAALSLDAALAGDAAKGTLTLTALQLALGGSGLDLAGSLDLPALTGKATLANLRLLPQDVAALQGVPLAESPLAGPVRGSGVVDVVRSSKGLQAMLSLKLDAGGGAVGFTATATLAPPLVYSGWLTLEDVDPGAALRGAPEGRVSLKLDLEGRGVPRYQDGAFSGDLDGTLVLGPARLEGFGKLSAHAEVALRGESLLVKRLEASALSLSIKGAGAVGPRALALDLDAGAADLARFARALGALEKKPPLQLTGSGRLKARVTGTPRSPQAEVHLTAPALTLGGLAVEALAIDGTLHGPLRAPKGTLTLGSRRVRLGDLRLGSPAIKATLDWPLAHLSLDANVRATEASGVAADPATGRRRGKLSVVGDARIDEDRDGVLLSNLTVSWPEATLTLEQQGHLHFHRRETVLDPVRLRGEAGAITLEATVEHPRGAAETAPAQLEARVGLEAFDLSRAPGFALPRGFALAGRCDADLGLTGTAAAPDVEGTLKLRGLAAQQLRGIDADLSVQLHRGRLRADGSVRGLLGAEAKLKASLPLQANAPATAPLELDLSYGPLALAEAARVFGLQGALAAGAAGTLTAKLSARGTLGAPRAAFTADLRDLAWKPLHAGRLDAELSVDKGAARLTAQLSLAGTRALTLEAREPFDLALALRDPSVLGHLFEKPGSAKLSTAGALELSVLERAGLLPAGSAGTLAAAVELGGSAAAPTLKLSATGRALSIKTLKGLDLDLHGEAGAALALGLELKAGEVALGALESSLRVSATELVGLARGGFARAQLDPLLARPLSLVLSVERLVLGETAKLAGAALETVGTLSGKITLAGTANEPQFEGRLLLDGLAVRGHSLGRSDAWVEGDKAGLIAHLGLTPPLAPVPLGAAAAAVPALAKAPAAQAKAAHNGTLLAHATLSAPLSASALLDGGLQPLLEGKLDAHLLARRLDLAFVSGVLPGLRRTAGVLDGEVSIEGLLGTPVSNGAAHLAGGSFDVVGQGIFEDVAFDATFSPKEIVLDRLTGSTGGGPFSGILVVGRRKAAAEGDTPPLEFTGELHFGDAEAVRDRTGPDGKPLAQRPVPLRQAGEERADFTAEVDLFGEWSSETGTLTTTVKVPEASVHVRPLSDKKLPSLTPNPEVLLAARPGEPRLPAGIDPVRAAAEEKARRESRLRADVRFELGKLHVSADDFDCDVTSSLHVSWDAQHPQEPSADGTIEVPRGSFSALGRRFEVERAVVTETGGDIADPEFEVQARYVNPQATVLVIVTGTAKDPQIDLSSNPAMDQDAIAFFLATGRLQGRATQQGGGVDLSNAATSALGGMLFGELRKQMADVMPVDVLTIEAGGGGRPAQASLGKYFGDRFFVGYRQRLTPMENENSSEGRIEYEIVRGLGAEATVGDKNRDVSVLYTRDF